MPLARFSGAFRLVGDPIDGLEVGQPPKPEKIRPGKVSVPAPHPEQRGAVIDFRALQQPRAGLRALCAPGPS